MHEHNVFLTLTYNEENLKSDKLDYTDFQKFMKKLRKTQNEPIGMFVTGEYGDKNKRPHWHAIIFNWSPKDKKYKYTNERGDKVYSSEQLDKLWSKGLCEIGSVTLESAGYCARYAAKKLIHGKDQDHEYHPISKKSSKQAIGKKWLEKYYKDVFSYGQIVLPDGQTCSIPRYYEKWLKSNRPDDWLHYVTKLKIDRIAKIHEKEEAQKQKEKEQNWERLNQRKPLLLNKDKVREKIMKKKFDELQKNLKL